MSNDTVILAFKTKLHLNNKQKSAFELWSRARRAAFNYGLNLCNVYLSECERTGDKNKLLNVINDFDKHFNASKYSLGFVRKGKGGGLVGTGGYTWIVDKKIPSSVCQMAIKYDLKEAWKRCFKGLGKQPKFQGRFRRSSFTVTSINLPLKSISGNRVKLPGKIGLATLGDKIPYSEYKLGNTSFICEAGNWYVSFGITVSASDYYKQIAKRKSVVGVDIGVKIYAATSDGDKKYSPEKLKILEIKKAGINKIIGKTTHKNLMLTVNKCVRCKELVKGISDKKRLCNVCRKTFKPLMSSIKIRKLRKSVERISAKQAHIRENMAHQLTTELVKNYDFIAIEDLQVKNMTASAKGDEENPGKMVKQKSGLNRVILNVAPYRFKFQLEYKANKFGAVLTSVPPQYTSQTCPACGHVAKENRATQDKFECIECGYENNADINAAQNIMQKGLKLLKNTSI